MKRISIMAIAIFVYPLLLVAEVSDSIILSYGAPYWCNGVGEALEYKYGSFNTIASKIGIKSGSYQQVCMSLIQLMRQQDPDFDIGLISASSLLATNIGTDVLLLDYATSYRPETVKRNDLVRGLLNSLFDEETTLRYAEINLKNIKKEYIKHFTKSKVSLIEALSQGNSVSVESILQNSPDVLVVKAHIYLNGFAGITNKNKAIQMLQEACDKGDAQGCIMLINLYEKGQDVILSNLKIVELKEKVCDLGDVKSCNEVASIYTFGSKGFNRNEIKASVFYKKACDKDDAEGCFKLGFNYNYGYGVKKSFLEAAKYYKKACDSGYANGCGFLGFLYEKGNGVQQNYSKAKALLKKACDGWHAEACEHLKGFN